MSYFRQQVSQVHLRLNELSCIHREDVSCILNGDSSPHSQRGWAWWSFDSPPLSFNTLKSTAFAELKVKEVKNGRLAHRVAISCTSWKEPKKPPIFFLKKVVKFFRVPPTSVRKFPNCSWIWACCPLPSSCAEEKSAAPKEPVSCSSQEAVVSGRLLCRVIAIECSCITYGTVLLFVICNLYVIVWKHMNIIFLPAHPINL